LLTEHLHQQTPHAEHNWHDFVQTFRQAFHQGDVQALEQLKTQRTDFANINDLGDEFLKYGNDMDKWDQLIQDAHNNVNNHGH